MKDLKNYTYRKNEQAIHSLYDINEIAWLVRSQNKICVEMN